MDISEIKDFFNDYAKTYLTFDVDSLANFFHFPCLIHDLSGIHLLTNVQDLRAYEQKFLLTLKEWQIHKIENEIIEHDSSHSLTNALGCKVSFKFFDKKNILLLGIDYNYSLIKDERWQILFARLGVIRNK